MTSEHPAYLGLVRKAEDWFKAQRTNRPPDESSVKIKHGIFSSQNDLQIAAAMVQDIRSHLEDTRLYCAVCLMLAADKNNEHEAGTRCPTVVLDGTSDDNWPNFKKGFSLPGGTTYIYSYTKVHLFLAPGNPPRHYYKRKHGEFSR